MEALLAGDTPSDANLHIFEQNGLFLPCKMPYEVVKRQLFYRQSKNQLNIRHNPRLPGDTP